MRNFLFLFVLACSACEAPPPPESRGDKLAKSLCGCTSQLLALNKQAEAAPDSLAFRNMADAFEKARACAVQLGIKPADSTLLDIALKTQCPMLSANQGILTELLKQ